MIENRNSTLKSFLFKRRFFFLLIMLLAMLVIVPFLGDYSRFQFVVDIVVTGIFIAAMYAISDKKYNLFLALFLVIPMFADIWVDYFSSAEKTLVVSQICGILFIGFAIFNIIHFMLKQKEVTREMIYAAVVVYLLMALLWSNVYQLLETFAPGSFGMPDGQMQNDRLLFLYFSLVTITTLGYGDMTPLTDRAAGLASVEALTGQIYLVVLVAWLVGMHVSKRSK
jgi:hypothetical protein